MTADTGGTAVLSIAYVSVATTDMTDADIAAILSQSRTNNVAHELTGALLFHAGRFIQILEGPDEEVLARFALISDDPRHRNVQKITEKFIAVRQFPEWTMGFRAVSGSGLRELDGFNDFFQARTGRARIEHAENEAQQFLEWLTEYWLAA